MATHKSAKKRARQAPKRRERNRKYLSSVRTAIKKFKTEVTGSEVKLDSLTKLLREAQSALSKAAQKGILHSNNAARHVSRLTLAFKKATGQMKPGTKVAVAATATTTTKAKTTKKPTTAAIKKAAAAKKSSAVKKSAPAKKKKS